MSLDEDKSFYFVVDGVVQVFARAEQPVKLQSGSWDSEDLNGYQLLNEVGAGGTLSSLFKILSLFTEHVQISWQSEGTSSGYQSPRPDERTKSHRKDSEVSIFNLDIPSHPMHLRRDSVSSSGSTIHAENAISPSGSSSRPPQSAASVRPPSTAEPDSLHHGVVARATEDTTLAVIPAEAFHRLTQKFPKAAAHIVQGQSI
jgi:lysophospholipid hydrolase